MPTPLARLFRGLLVALSLGGCALAGRAAPPDTSDLRLGDLLLVGFAGTRLDGNEELRQLLCDVKAGGVILFERWAATGQPRNISSAEQVEMLTGEIQSLALRCAGRRVFVAADNEGGRVMRLSTRLGYLPTPSPDDLGEQGDVALTQLEARRMGATLREAGINWNLAPVVDVAINPANPAVVTLGRTFSSDPDRVISQARGFILGMHEAGVLTALKHFPGHGSSRGDSHLGFTDVSDTAELDVELKPYRVLIREGLADSVMTAHVFNRHLDPWDPATLSRFTVDRILRGSLDYGGVVVSDDLLMGAITQHYGLEEAAVLALQAGVDVLLISQNVAQTDDRAAGRVVAAVAHAVAQGKLSRRRISESLARIDALRERLPR